MLVSAWRKASSLASNIRVLAILPPRRADVPQEGVQSSLTASLPMSQWGAASSEGVCGAKAKGLGKRGRRMDRAHRTQY